MSDRFYSRAEVETIVSAITAARESGDRDTVTESVKTLVKYHSGYEPLED